MATIPPVPRHVASVLVHALRHVLVNAAPGGWQAKDYQSNLDGLMRLPLGRHAFTRNVAWMLADDATVLPLDRQAQAVHIALAAPSTMPTVWIGEILAFLAARGVSPEEKQSERILPVLAEQLPQNGLMTTFRSACAQFDIPFLTRPLVVNLAADCAAGASIADRELVTSTQRRLTSHIPVDKRHALAIFDGGYGISESYVFHMAKTQDGGRGKNGIGMALILADGDVERARRMLHIQARTMPAASIADVNARISRINYYLNLDPSGLPYNKTYQRLQALLAIRKHKSLDGGILPEETHRATEVVSRLVELRRLSDHRVKTYQPKALVVVRHIIELLQMAVRRSEDRVARASYRTLAAEITGRWSDDATSATEVSRQMQWIVSGPICLFCVVDVAERPMSKFQAITYTLASDFLEVMSANEGNE